MQELDCLADLGSCQSSSPGTTFSPVKSHDCFCSKSLDIFASIISVNDAVKTFCPHTLLVEEGREAVAERLAT